jgi:2-oxo-4-hydroxy-4-carboxy--5-ureidoimidazoline (OHCU) decarboxylase
MPATAERLAAVFERAPGLVERLAPIVPPGTLPEAVIAAARGIIASLPEPERIAILNAHPRIGADPASLSAASRAEQGAAADQNTLAELVHLNAEYERRFGFRFVVFVGGRSKAEIVPILRERLRHAREDELETGIGQFLLISLDRLRKAK